MYIKITICLLRFLISVAGYIRMDKKRSIDIRQELYYIQPRRYVKDHQQNYSEHILSYSLEAVLLPPQGELEESIWLALRLEQVKRPNVAADDDFIWAAEWPDTN